MPNDNQTLELPQVFSRTVGPIQPVSVFQGYNPRTMAQVEGPYRGGWAPLMQDPVTYAAMGPTMGLGRMFQQAAYQGLPQLVPQRAMPQPSVMAGWQKIPNTTEPDIEGRTPTAFASSRPNPEWAGRVDVTDPRTAAMRGRTSGNYGVGWRSGYPTNPFPYTPDPKGGGWTRVGSEGKPDVPDPRPNYADIRKEMQQRVSDAEKLAKQRQFEGYYKAERGPDGGWVKIPVSTYQGKMSAPLPPRWGEAFEEHMRQHASPEGLTVSGHLVPIPEQQPLRIKDADNFYMMPAQGYLPGEDVTFGRPTAPLDTGIQINRAGYATAPGDFTRPLSITDLFKEFPE